MRVSPPCEGLAETVLDAGTAGAETLKQERSERSQWVAGAIVRAPGRLVGRKPGKRWYETKVERQAGASSCRALKAMARSVTLF